MYLKNIQYLKYIWSTYSVYKENIKLDTKYAFVCNLIFSL